MQTAFLLVGLAVLASAAARAQTDVSASLYGAFTGTSTGTYTTQSPSNAAGGMLEVRHIAKPWFGYEGTYSFNRANQVYSETNLCPGVGCPNTTTAAVSANAHEFTGDWVGSLKIGNLRPFVLAGGGLLIDVPSGQAIISIRCVGTCCVGICPLPLINNATSTSTTPVFVYGGGVDWGLLPHIGLRLQYRGNLYRAPDVGPVTSTGAFTHTAEPMLGAYFRF
jgi:hypothetical protein